ncbi:hypothetical protein WN48_04736 [Eufriesea mexicana]|nr:hypothetical protein WN48_04736 [Eufriesea mexicana]
MKQLFSRTTEDRHSGTSTRMTPTLNAKSLRKLANSTTKMLASRISFLHFAGNHADVLFTFTKLPVAQYPLFLQQQQQQQQQLRGEAQSSDEGKHEAHSRRGIPSEIDAPGTYHGEKRFYIVCARLFDFAFR